MSEQPNTPATEEQTSPQFHYEVMPDDYTQYDLSFKVIVIGDSGVGKSCLTNKATNNIFDLEFQWICLKIELNKNIVKSKIG